MKMVLSRAWKPIREWSMPMWVIVAAGVRPNMGLAAQAGLRTEQGIRVDDYMATSDSDIFAAGDVAEAKDLLTGEYTVRPIWAQRVHSGTICRTEHGRSRDPLYGRHVHEFHYLLRVADDFCR